MFSKQETFDTVAAHLLKQGKQAKIKIPNKYIAGDEIEICAYRGADGTKCAAGILIPDELYGPHLEQNSVFDLVLYDPEFFGHDTDLVIQLQSIHDNSAPQYWREDLKSIANHHKLEFKFG